MSEAEAYTIEITSADEARAALSILFNKGIGWTGGLGRFDYNTVPLNRIRRLFVSKGASLTYAPSGADLYGAIDVNLSELAKIDCSRLVKMTESYTAMIHQDKTGIGCQRFENKKILELAEAITKQRRAGE